mgnify:CR=1 FL=1
MLRIFKDSLTALAKTLIDETRFLPSALRPALAGFDQDGPPESSPTIFWFAAPKKRVRALKTESQTAGLLGLGLFA